MSEILKEAERLHGLGFAIHWLHNKSKRPVESGWTNGPRTEWGKLKTSYREGYNIGVRLGRASKIKGHFLGVIDVDVKSKNERHAKEVARLIGELVGEHSLPEVQSGRGNNSRHYYILAKEPLTPRKLHQSKDIVKVAMPSAQKPSKKELEHLTPEELKKGIRLRPAWEIAAMGEGQQVVLPPSIHPDSGKPYIWKKPFEPRAAAKKLKFPEIEPPKEVNSKVQSKVSSPEPKFEFEPEVVDVGWIPISEKIRQMILTGEGVEDRSAMLLPITHALKNAGLSNNEILSVLTDSKNFIGQTAFDHAKTSSRIRAAKWVWSFTLKKVEKESRHEEMFREPIGEAKQLSDEEMQAEQAAQDKSAWWRALDRTEKGKLRPTVHNVISILENVVGSDIFKHDVFALRDFYAKETPWQKKVGKAVADVDFGEIRIWLGQTYSIEPPAKPTISQAVINMAMKNSFDPVLDFLNGLPKWDEKPRLDGWLKKNFQAKGNDDYLDQVFRKWICGMVMRIRKPGAHFPWMPIFEGAQGIGKSSFGRLLVGDKYFLDWLPSLADKDAALALQGMWAVEMGELASLRKNEIEIVKGFVTRTTDKVRPPYGERWIESPRRCVFFGTTNSKKYLQDDSGNRRFKPVEVGYLNFDQLAEDREQLFAEAIWLIDHGFESEYTVEISGEARRFEKGVHAEKMVKTTTDLMAEILFDFFEKESPKDDLYKFPKDGFKMVQLFDGLGVKGAPAGPFTRWPYNPSNERFAGDALHRIGATKKHTKLGSVWSYAKNEGLTIHQEVEPFTENPNDFNDCE